MQRRAAGVVPGGVGSVPVALLLPGLPYLTGTGLLGHGKAAARCQAGGQWGGGLCCKVRAPMYLPGWSLVKNDVSETATATRAGASPAGRLQVLQARASRPTAPPACCSGTLLRPLQPCTNLCLTAADSAVGHEQKSPKSLSCSCAAKPAREPWPLLHTRAFTAVAESPGHPPSRERPRPPAPSAWPSASRHRGRPGARPRLIILSSLAALPPHKPDCQALT